LLLIVRVVSVIGKLLQPAHDAARVPSRVGLSAAGDLLKTRSQVE
jgi:hypothetical protein